MNHLRELLTVVAFSVLTAFAASRLPDLESDHAFERWIDPTTPSARLYEEFRENFPSDQFILASVTHDPPFDPSHFDLLVDAVSRIEELEGVARVSSLPTLFRDVFGSEDVADLAAEVSSAPFYDRLLISDDRRTLGIFVHLSSATGAAERARVVREVRTVLEKAGVADAALVGPSVLNAAIDEVSDRELRASLPTAALLSTLALLVLFGALRPVLIALACSAVTVIGTLALGDLLGWKLSMISTALAPLIWVLSLSGSTHLLASYRRLRATRPREEAIRHAVVEVARPCSLAAATTAIGLLSLTASGFRPIREFGVLAGAGLMLGVIVTFGLGRSMLALVDTTPASRLDLGVGRAAGRLAAASARHRWLTLAVAGVAIAAGTSALPLLSADSNPLRFLGPTERVIADYHHALEALTGLSPLEVLIDEVGGVDDLVQQPHLDELAARLASEPGVAKVVSPMDVLRKMNQWHHDLEADRYILPTADRVEDVLANADPLFAAELASMHNAEAGKARLTALVTPLESSDFLALAERFQDHIIAGGLVGRAHPTGTVLQLVRSQGELVRSQLRSLGVALVLVFMSIAVGLRSLRMTLLSLAPNLVPVVWVFASMALAGIPLDPGTVMVAGIALGIAVDDSVHLLTAVRRARLRGVRPLEAVRSSAEALGPALCITTFAVVAGMAALLGSAFVPIHYFAVLTTAAMLVALLADLTLLPALLRGYTPRPRVR
ncbi:MAG: MMPL family transporter [Acidobacteriota bacterium]|nr:MMPL family transporter [Acidobacteriota bacterium]